jgi:hypothetical protein
MSLIAAIGAVAVARWTREKTRSTLDASGGVKRRALGPLVAGAFCAWVLVAHVIYLRQYFGEFFESPGKYWQRHVDVMEACAWLGPRFDDVDAVFLTHEMLPFPHVLPLVFLEYDPRRWFAEPREYVPCPPTLQAEVVCARFGKVRIMYQPELAKEELTAMESDGARQRVVLILRPRQRPPGRTPDADVRHRGVAWLYLYDLEI